MEAEKSEVKQVEKPSQLVGEYVQNLVDVVSEQMNMHVREMTTIDKINKLTLRKQGAVLESIQATNKNQQEEESKVEAG